MVNSLQLLRVCPYPVFQVLALGVLSILLGKIAKLAKSQMKMICEQHIVILLMQNWIEVWTLTGKSRTWTFVVLSHSTPSANVLRSEVLFKFQCPLSYRTFTVCTLFFPSYRFSNSCHKATFQSMMLPQSRFTFVYKK